MSNVNIPAQEVDLSTRRQRLYHLTWLNRHRLDKQLRPLLRELEDNPNDSGRMGILFKATFRGAVTLINHYLHFDIREHPSAILLVLLKVVDDRTFDSVWSDYAPMIEWCNRDGSSNEGSTAPTITAEQGTIEPDTASILSAIDRGDAWVRKDNIRAGATGKNSRKAPNSDTGHET